MKSLQEASQTQIRDDLIDLKVHIRELEALQRSIADQNQADRQALLQWQAELKDSIQALHDNLRTKLDLFSQKKIEEPTSKENNPFKSSHILLGIAQVIGSGIASGIGAMAVISSQRAVGKPDEAGGHLGLPQMASSMAHPLCDEAWENAYREAEKNEYSKHPSRLYWWACHECGREVNIDINSDDCPDCWYTMCFDCNDSKSPDTLDARRAARAKTSRTRKWSEEAAIVKSASTQSGNVTKDRPKQETFSTSLKNKDSSLCVSESVPSYRICEATLISFLEEIFGNLDFEIRYVEDRYVFEIPRALTKVSPHSSISH